MIPTYILPALSGLLLTLSFPNCIHNQFHWFTNVVAWFSLVPLFFAIEHASPKQAFRQGYVAGLVFFLTSIYWFNYVKPMGNAAPVGWLAACAYLAVYPALFAALVRLGLKKALAWPMLWIPALWTLLEYAREIVITGFPWISLGSSQYLNPLALRVASATGVYGLHFLVALGNLVIFKLVCGIGLSRREVIQAGVAASLLAGLGLASGLARPENLPPVAVAVIQGNIDQDQPWTGEYRDGLMKAYLELMDQAAIQGAKVMLWPEATLPGLFSENSAQVKALKTFAKARGADLIISGYDFDQVRRGYTNSAFKLDPTDQSRVETYAKQHLVPFGEYVPFRKVFSIIDKAVKRFGVEDLAPGPGPAVFHTQAGLVAPLICYEGIFPSLSRDACRMGAQVLAVQTFDTWYGDSAAPYQHVALAVFRAAEEGRWLARAGATGVSCFISPQGRITKTVALNTRGFAVEDVVPMSGRTIYQIAGNWFLWVCLVICGAAIWRRAKPLGR